MSTPWRSEEHTSKISFWFGWVESISQKDEIIIGVDVEVGTKAVVASLESTGKVGVSSFPGRPSFFGFGF